MVEYSIKDLEFLSGIKAHTLRIWEMRYGFIKPDRSFYNFRKYSKAHLKIVLIIAHLQRSGFKLAKLKELDFESLEKKTRDVSTDHQRIEKRVLDMLIAYLDFNIPLFELYVQEYIQRKGIDKAISQLVIPFLERSRVMYNFDRHILFDQIIRAVIKNFFQSAITASSIPSTKVNDIVLFTPEENNDEISLSFAYYSLYSKGLNVLNVGMISSFELLMYLKENSTVKAFVTVLSCQKKFNLERFIYYFHQNIPDVPLLVLGTSTETYNGRVPKNVNIVKSMSEAAKYFS